VPEKIPVVDSYQSFAPKWRRTMERAAIDSIRDAVRAAQQLIHSPELDSCDTGDFRSPLAQAVMIGLLARRRQTIGPLASVKI
jgi:hypothetical protein